ncbi:hypothetical protein BCV72DRAFT_334109 [Rhizopus microsporus var. microsporus]|uniref:Uncharacterized protein n=2 Tax=Rhizopus microsporus TaxID=58291 RepID=A0A2G4SRK3_RHIZD|nr:uncharacterized protein RHIMIDRAFT_292943 [Rhizopus microsporus ATCC 52813]ORE08926.1 hypothetical protein BCV72DRAFT_334109 [Rhizopus microsporus var. microsporus]PHZ11390.1 hypothetical protein RHIMIDRAFT_292943 [Rhizopus microsporus ATCC 52813]
MQAPDIDTLFPHFERLGIFLNGDYGVRVIQYGALLGRSCDIAVLTACWSAVGILIFKGLQGTAALQTVAGILEKLLKSAMGNSLLSPMLIEVVPDGLRELLHLVVYCNCYWLILEELPG